MKETPVEILFRLGEAADRCREKGVLRLHVEEADPVDPRFIKIEVGETQKTCFGNKSFQLRFSRRFSYVSSMVSLQAHCS